MPEVLGLKEKDVVASLKIDKPVWQESQPDYAFYLSLLCRGKVKLVLDAENLEIDFPGGTTCDLKVENIQALKDNPGPLTQDEIATLISEYFAQNRDAFGLISNTALAQEFMRSEIPLLTQLTDVPFVGADKDDDKERARRRKIFTPEKVTRLLIESAIHFKYWKLIRTTVNYFVMTGKIDPEKIEQFSPTQLNNQEKDGCMAVYIEIMKFYRDNTELN